MELSQKRSKYFNVMIDFILALCFTKKLDPSTHGLAFDALGLAVFGCEKDRMINSAPLCRVKIEAII